jgi:energy-coupling factor transport system ATP-binding protein
VDRLSYAYPDGRVGLEDVSLELERGEVVAVLGPSGSGKSTLLRALAGLVPHFHGGRFAGRVEVAGRDTRRTRPAELAGTVATLFQDPEDQLVLSRVESEIAFGLENVGVPPALIANRVEAALASVGASHLAARRVAELSGGELQRVCLAATLALDPALLLLDEPTSQLDAEAAESLLDLACDRGIAVVVSEQRPRRPLQVCDRVLFLERGRLRLDAPREEALAWLAEHRPAWVDEPERPEPSRAREVVCDLDQVSFAYTPGVPVLDGIRIELNRGEVVALVGPNGSGKTTLAKLASGLLEPDSGAVFRSGRACYLPQDPGRHLVRERVDEEVALAADRPRAREALAQVGLAGYEARHPRDLSSGERERVALAAVLAPQPALLVLDEPTRGVDPERKRELAALLRAQRPRRATLVVTHDTAFAAAVADRVVSTAPEREALVA